MKHIEIYEMTTKELSEKVIDDKLLLAKMKLNHHVNPLDNPKKLNQMRKNIARMKTELRKRQLKEIIK